nr:MAG TPA: hypothetical protein [Caudoviricetes sp.]DAW90778.1 MAG TPA: hypothetical protein [Bacteriophage sp.]
MNFERTSRKCTQMLSNSERTPRNDLLMSQ